MSLILALLFSKHKCFEFDPYLISRVGVYIISAVHCISPKRSFAYHQAATNNCGLYKKGLQRKIFRR